MFKVYLPQDITRPFNDVLLILWNGPYLFSVVGSELGEDSEHLAQLICDIQLLHCSFGCIQLTWKWIPQKWHDDDWHEHIRIMMLCWVSLPCAISSNLMEVYPPFFVIFGAIQNLQAWQSKKHQGEIESTNGAATHHPCFTIFFTFLESFRHPTWQSLNR